MLPAPRVVHRQRPSCSEPRFKRVRLCHAGRVLCENRQLSTLQNAARQPLKACVPEGAIQENAWHTYCKGNRYDFKQTHIPSQSK